MTSYAPALPGPPRLPRRWGVRLLTATTAAVAVAGGLGVAAQPASAQPAASVAVYRPSSGTWYVRGAAAVRWGLKGDIPVPGDYTGDHRAAPAVWRPSTGTWYVRGAAAVRWGVKGDIPVPGDYTGAGRIEPAVWRPSTGTWYIRGVGAIRYGLPGDRPVPASYHGGTRTDIAVWRPSTGTWYVRGMPAVQYGRPGDIPIPGDVNGDGRTDLAVWRPSTGTWYVRGRSAVQWGRTGDVPAIGDYNNDAHADLAVWRPSTGTWYVRGIATVSFGLAGDVPVPADYLGVGAPQTVDQQIAGYARTFVGRYPYTYGGASPATGFDCSGLTSYVYRHYGLAIARTTQSQYGQFRQIPRSAARPGDLVFFHDSGSVFHVGVYEGSGMMVSAATPQDGIRYQTIWSSNVTFGTITH